MLGRTRLTSHRGVRLQIVIVNETGRVTGYEIGATVRGRGSRGRREVEVEGHGAGRVADVFVDAKVSVSNA